MKYTSVGQLGTKPPLYIREAYTEDVGKGVARIDVLSAKDLGLWPNDIVMIEGKKGAVPARIIVDDCPNSGKTIRIDKMTRYNLGLEVGDQILSISRADSGAAEKVMIESVLDFPPIDPRFIADALDGVPITEGQVVLLPYFNSALAFVVAAIGGREPDHTSTYIVTQKTQFEMG